MSIELAATEGLYHTLMAEPLAKSLECSGISYLVRASAALLGRVGPPRVLAAAEAVPDSAEGVCMNGRALR